MELIQIALIFFNNISIVLLEFIEILITIVFESVFNVRRPFRHSSQNTSFLIKKKVFRFVPKNCFFLGHAKKLMIERCFFIGLKDL